MLHQKIIGRSFFQFSLPKNNWEVFFRPNNQIIFPAPLRAKIIFFARRGAEKNVSALATYLSPFYLLFPYIFLWLPYLSSDLFLKNSLSPKKAIGRSKDLPIAFLQERDRAGKIVFLEREERERGCFRFFAGESMLLLFCEREIFGTLEKERLSVGESQREKNGDRKCFAFGREERNVWRDVWRETVEKIERKMFREKNGGS